MTKRGPRSFVLFWKNNKNSLDFFMWNKEPFLIVNNLLLAGHCSIAIQVLQYCIAIHFSVLVLYWLIVVQKCIVLVENL